jgi:hypothetical protein
MAKATLRGLVIILSLVTLTAGPATDSAYAMPDGYLASAVNQTLHCGGKKVRLACPQAVGREA